jgi:putative sigma-54 modulation protein
MQIQIRGRDVELDGAVHEYIERSLLSSIGRLSSRVRHMMVQILDLNGPRGGRDKECRVEVRLHPSGRIFVKAREAQIHAAVDRVADRLARAVTRSVERGRVSNGTDTRWKL